MNTEQMVSITQEIVEDFNNSRGHVELAMLLKNNYKDAYTLLFSSKVLDDKPPFDAIREVVGFFRERDDEILEKISSIVTVHSEDSSVHRVKGFMLDKGDVFFIENNEGIELFDIEVNDAIIIKEMI